MVVVVVEVCVSVVETGPAPGSADGSSTVSVGGSRGRGHDLGLQFGGIDRKLHDLAGRGWGDPSSHLIEVRFHAIGITGGQPAEIVRDILRRRRTGRGL